MIEEINKRQKKKFIILFSVLLFLSIIIFLLSLMIGQYGFIPISEIFKMIGKAFGAQCTINNSSSNIIEFVRLPRTLAAFLIGGSLSIAGLVYQNTFNNKLVSPDILGVSAGSCVGAGIAILLGLSGFFVGLSAFVFGFIAVLIALLLPKLFKNKSSLMLILSGIIVGAFMNSIIGIIKFLADKEDKLSAITFWMLGSVSNVKMIDILYVLPLIVVSTIVLIVMSHRIDVISLGEDEAKSLGINYKRNRLIIIICSTVLTAASVAISGNVGWVGLVIPHLTRVIIGNKSKDCLPLSFLFGGSFMMVVDMMSRTISVENIPLSIITGIFGAVIYSIVLIKKGRELNE
ncbi:MAG: iron ABC transporter permease [Bacilli bacterium]|nr:iron ABC transporter permease [Bacilli bacterium]